jgi:hypothetical protein
LCVCTGSIVVWSKLNVKLHSTPLTLKIIISVLVGLNFNDNRCFIRDWSFHAGVPQGSVLGTLMFLIFINDITDEIVGLGHLFADDTSISANLTLVTCFASNASNIL